MSATQTPTLDALLASGAIHVEDDEYVGTASDGAKVSVGVTWSPLNAERYLADHPTSADW